MISLILLSLISVVMILALVGTWSNDPGSFSDDDVYTRRISREKSIMEKMMDLQGKIWTSRERFSMTRENTE